MRWTETQLLQFAPDAATVSRGQGLASVGKWLELCTDGNVLWGKCKGSGSLPYFAMVDTVNAAFKCSCPARKFPCKHALALGLLYIREARQFQQQTPPDNVQTWVANRQKRLENAAPTAEKSPEAEKATEERKAKTLDSRIENIIKALPELEAWLLDTVREGIASIEKDAHQICEAIAVRLSDAQLKGIATRIRELPPLIGNAPNWIEKVTTTLGELYLFLNAFRQYDNLPEPLQAELRQIAGIALKKEEIRTDAGVADEWLILGKADGEDVVNPSLYFQRVWLWGAHSKRPAMILDYNFGSANFAHSFALGTKFRGELAFYPSSFPLRAVLKTQEAEQQDISNFPGFDDFDNFLKAYANAVAENPWLRTFPCVLSGVVPIVSAGKVAVADKHAELLPLASDALLGWKLVALSGGTAIDIFGEWDGDHLMPLSACVAGAFVNLVQ